MKKEGLYIVRAICAAEIDPMRLTERDTKAYCGIILDGNRRKYFMRMHCLQLSTWSQSALCTSMSTALEMRLD